MRGTGCPGIKWLLTRYGRNRHLGNDKTQERGSPISVCIRLAAGQPLTTLVRVIRRMIAELNYHIYENQLPPENDLSYQAPENEKCSELPTTTTAGAWVLPTSESPQHHRLVEHQPPGLKPHPLRDREFFLFVAGRGFHASRGGHGPFQFPVIPRIEPNPTKKKAS
jgi:hypothetical protein